MKSKLAIVTTPGNTCRIAADLVRAIEEVGICAFAEYGRREPAGIPLRHELAQAPVEHPGYPVSGSRRTGAAAIKRQSRKRGRR